MEQQDPEEEQTLLREKKGRLIRQDSLRMKSKEEGEAFVAKQNDTISMNDIDSIPSFSDEFCTAFLSPRRRVRGGSSLGQIFPRSVKQKLRSPLSSKRSARSRSYSLNNSRSRTGTDTSETEGSFDLSDTSDFESDAQFSDFDEANGIHRTERRKCFTRPDRQYNDIQSMQELSPTKRETMEFSNWLRDVAKISEPDMDSSEVQMRFGLFLHFLRMDISALELSKDSIRTHQEWYEKNHFVMEEYVSYVRVPLDVNRSYLWWFDPESAKFPNNVPKEEQDTVYICHRLQTFTESQQRSRRTRRHNEKVNFTIDLMKGNPIPVLTTYNARLSKSRERHLNWAISWTTASGRKVPHHLRVSAGRVLASLAWPDERIPGLRSRLWMAGAAQRIVNMAKTGEIQLHRHVDYEKITLDKVIGKGAVGTVYSARHNGQPVAVKVTKETTLAFTEEEFLFEVALMCALDHPNILSCLGAGIIAPYYFFISPYQGRGSLRMVLNDRFEPLPWVRRIHIAKEIAIGIQYLHSKGLMHRDIKGENILIGYDWDVRIIDFGTSRFFGKVDTSEKDSMIGTAEWMAPEMILDGKEYSDKVDIYSYGILLYEIFTRNYPYYEVERRFEIIKHVQEGNRPIFNDEDIPFKILRTLMTNCWHKHPKKRPNWPTILDKLEDAEIKAQKKAREDAAIT